MFVLIFLLPCLNFFVVLFKFYLNNIDIYKKNIIIDLNKIIKSDLNKRKEK